MARESTAGAVVPPAETTERARPKLTGFGKLLYDLRHRRRRFRQFVGVAFVFWLTLVATPSPLGLAAGALVVALGMAVRLWASGFVMKNEVLATVGPYAWVRHPLYVGNILIGVGFCVASGRWWAWPAYAVMLFLFYPGAIRYEDAKLRGLFPGTWEPWAARTRALIPGLRPFDGARQPGQPPWSFRTSMRRNGEPIHVAVGVLCLAYLFWRLPG